jgi:hypothetical protein
MTVACILVLVLVNLSVCTIAPDDIIAVTSAYIENLSLLW